MSVNSARAHLAQFGKENDILFFHCLLYTSDAADEL